MKNDEREEREKKWKNRQWPELGTYREYVDSHKGVESSHWER